MRSRLFALVLIVLAMVSALFWFNLNPPGIIMIDPARPPRPILAEAELEKLTTLQDTQELFLLSGVSPDDSTILVAAGSSDEAGPKQAGWLDIQTGALEPIDEEFFNLPPESQVAWSSDRTVVYVSANEAGDPVLVRLDRATGEIQTEALPVNGRPLSLAPNGSRLLMEVGSSEGLDLMLSNLETGASRKLMSYANGGGPQSAGWTADGGKVAFVRYIVPPELASDSARINEIVMQDALGNLPLDQNPMFSGNVLDVFDLLQQERLPSTLHTESGDGYLFHQVAWSPDGERLVVRLIQPSQPAGRPYPVVVVGAFPDRASYRVYDAELSLVKELDYPEIQAPLASRATFVSPDELIFIAAYGLSFHLYYYDMRSGEFREVPAAAGTFAEAPGGYQVHPTHHSRQLIYNWSSFLLPPEVYRLSLDGGEPQALTRFNAQAAKANQVRVDEVSFQLEAGVTRIGYLLQPADAPFPPQNISLVLYQQGGPGGAMTNRWGATAEEPFGLLPNFGFGVLFMPFSGREGFGPEFYRALADGDNFGQLDILEGGQAVQYLIEHDYVRPGRVGITGCSYGGYFAAQSLTQYPELYAAANVQCAVLDMVKWWEPNPFLVTFMEGSRPADRMEEYLRDSPYYRASQVKAPVLLFHGRDDTLPFQIVRDFRKGIDQEIAPVRMLVFRNEGHTLSSPASRLIAAQEQIAWFRKYLNP